MQRQPKHYSGSHSKVGALRLAKCNSVIVCQSGQNIRHRLTPAGNGAETLQTCSQVENLSCGALVESRHLLTRCLKFASMCQQMKASYTAMRMPACRADEDNMLDLHCLYSV